MNKIEPIIDSRAQSKKKYPKKAHNSIEVYCRFRPVQSKESYCPYYDIQKEEKILINIPES